MRVGYLGIALTVAFVFNSCAADAQEIFGGRGIRGAEPVEPAPKSRWPRLLNFSKEEPRPASVQPFSGHTYRGREQPERRETAPFSLPTFNKPSFDWMKRPGLRTEGEPTRPFSGLTDMFPKRDPDQPSLFEQMNNKSKNMIDRTSTWAQQKNQNLRDRTFDTWDAITRDFRHERPIESDSMSPAQPPVRTAEASGQPRVRF